MRGRPKTTWRRSVGRKRFREGWKSWIEVMEKYQWKQSLEQRFGGPRSSTPPYDLLTLRVSSDLSSIYSFGLLIVSFILCLNFKVLSDKQEQEKCVVYLSYMSVYVNKIHFKTNNNNNNNSNIKIIDKLTEPPSSPCLPAKPRAPKPPSDPGIPSLPVSPGAPTSPIGPVSPSRPGLPLIPGLPGNPGLPVAPLRPW